MAQIMSILRLTVFEIVTLEDLVYKSYTPTYRIYIEIFESILFWDTHTLNVSKHI